MLQIPPAAWNLASFLSVSLRKRDLITQEGFMNSLVKKLLRLAHPTYSFLTSNDPRAHFGLGKSDRVEALHVLWPSGKKERFTVPAVDRVLTIHEGEGQPD